MLTIQDPNYFWLWKAGNAFFIFLTIYFFYHYLVCDTLGMTGIAHKRKFTALVYLCVMNSDNDILFEEKKLNILYVTAVNERRFKLVNHPSILKAITADNGNTFLFNMQNFFWVFKYLLARSVRINFAIVQLLFL